MLQNFSFKTILLVNYFILIGHGRFDTYILPHTGENTMEIYLLKSKNNKNMVIGKWVHWQRGPVWKFTSVIVFLDLCYKKNPQYATNRQARTHRCMSCLLIFGQSFTAFSWLPRLTFMAFRNCDEITASVRERNRQTGGARGGKMREMERRSVRDKDRETDLERETETERSESWGQENSAR